MALVQESIVYAYNVVLHVFVARAPSQGYHSVYYGDAPGS